MPETKPESLNPLEALAAIRAMKETLGWRLLMHKYSEEGDVVLTEILKLDTEPGEKYTRRDLLAYQLHALGRLQACINQIETEGKAEFERQKGIPR